MSGRRHFCYGLLVGWLVGFLFGLIGFVHHLQSLKQEAIELEHAEYDKQTGVWKWKGGAN